MTTALERILLAHVKAAALWRTWLGLVTNGAPDKGEREKARAQWLAAEIELSELAQQVTPGEESP